MHLAETLDDAREQARFGLKDQVDYLNNNMPRIFIPDGVDPVDWLVEQGNAVIGTPDDATARIERLHEKTGEFGAVLLGARYVIPHFEKYGEPRQDSCKWVTKHQAELTQKRKNAAQAMFGKHEAEWSQRGKRAAHPEKGNESTFG